MPNIGANEEMKIMTINIPKKLHKFMLKLKEWGLIPSISEILRHTCIKYCQELYELTKKVEKDTINFDPKKFVLVPNDDNTYDVHTILRRLD